MSANEKINKAVVMMPVGPEAEPSRGNGDELLRRLFDPFLL